MPHTKEEYWNQEIEELCKKALKDHERHFVTLECCANGKAYAKPDTLKKYLLWPAKKVKDLFQESVIGEAQGSDSLNSNAIQVTYLEGVQKSHRSLYELFVRKDFVLFPFNTSDSRCLSSISPISIDEDLRDIDLLKANTWILPRFSTASRSCLVLIPDNLEKLEKIDYAVVGNVNIFEETRLAIIGQEGIKPQLNKMEWDILDKILNPINGKASVDCLNPFKSSTCLKVQRAPSVLPIDQLGKAVSTDGIRFEGQNYRLYSIKTGVSYVGSTNEEGAGKNWLEKDSELAMTRSAVIHALKPVDDSIDIQIELLTITAPVDLGSMNEAKPGGRDGFQVRDLSGLRPGLAYLPAQAIPYCKEGFDESKGLKDAVTFWRNNFAIPLGRAKALLFFRYGLIHQSANAQNFVLGFDPKNELQQIVLRDIGDTAWHDTYIENFLNTGSAQKIFSQYNREKANSKFKKLLTELLTMFYQPPHIIRLSANTLLTHGFGKQMISNNKWQVGHLYELASGVLEGFRTFFEEAFSELIPQQSLYNNNVQTPMTKDVIIKEGKAMAYPYAKDKNDAYTGAIERYQEQKPKTLFETAAYIHQNGKGWLNDKMESISPLINAEEFYLCLGIESMLGLRPKGGAITPDNKTFKSKIAEHNAKNTWPKVVSTKK